MTDLQITNTMKEVSVECATDIAWIGFAAFMKVLNGVENGEATLLGNREKHVTAMRHAYKAMVAASE